MATNAELEAELTDLKARLDWLEQIAVTHHLDRHGALDPQTDPRLLRRDTERTILGRERIVMQKLRERDRERMPSTTWTGDNLDDIRELADGKASAILDEGHLKILQNGHEWYVRVGTRLYRNDYGLLKIDDAPDGGENLDLYRNAVAT